MMQTGWPASLFGNLGHKKTNPSRVREPRIGTEDLGKPSHSFRDVQHVTPAGQNADIRHAPIDARLGYNFGNPRSGQVTEQPTDKRRQQLVSPPVLPEALREFGAHLGPSGHCWANGCVTVWAAACTGLPCIPSAISQAATAAPLAAPPFTKARRAGDVARHNRDKINQNPSWRLGRPRATTCSGLLGPVWRCRGAYVERGETTRARWTSCSSGTMGGYVGV